MEDLQGHVYVQSDSREKLIRLKMSIPKPGRHCVIREVKLTLQPGEYPRFSRFIGDLARQSGGLSFSFHDERTAPILEIAGKLLKMLPISEL